MLEEKIMTAEALRALKEKAYRLYDSGPTKGKHVEVAAACDVSRATIFRWLKERREDALGRTTTP